jgi:hypothetical protein
MLRREFIAGLGSAAACPLVAWAQQGERPHQDDIKRTPFTPCPRTCNPRQARMATYSGPRDTPQVKKAIHR